MLFRDLASAFDQLEQTSSRRGLVEILAQILGSAGDDEVGQVVYLCQGRLVPFYEPIEIGLGEQYVAEAIGRANAAERAEVLRRYATAGDLGLVAHELATAAGRDASATSPSIADVHAALL